jgi:hypothetical protein
MYGNTNNLFKQIYLANFTDYKFISSVLFFDYIHFQLSKESTKARIKIPGQLCVK